MNKKLYDAVAAKIKAIDEEKNRIVEEYKKKSHDEKLASRDAAQKKIDELNSMRSELYKARHEVYVAYNELRNSNTQSEIEEAQRKLYLANVNLCFVAEQFGIAYDAKDEVSIRPKTEDGKKATGKEKPTGKNESTKEGKNEVLTAVAIGGVLGVLGTLGTGLAITSCNNSKTNNGSTRQVITEQSQNEQIDFGMTTKLTDASDEKQVMARAQEIYNLYINSADITEETKAELSVEKIANIIRMCNGEFAQEDGEVRYSRGENDVTSFQELGNWINAYSNSTSYANYKNNLRFKPMSVFFEEDTTAYKIALKADELVKNIYDDIRANNVEKFQMDAKAWGNFVKYTVIQNDFDPNYISLWTVDSEQMYPLLKTITTTFAPSTLEYAINVGIANQHETYGVCIPYCLENGQMQEKPVSLLIYDINNTPMNALAERVGKYDEWASMNEPIMNQVGYTAKDWFDSKYDREVGYQRKLK